MAFTMPCCKRTMAKARLAHFVLSSTRRAARALGCLLVVLWLFSAQGTELRELKIKRNDEGVWVSYALNFELPTQVQDALMKGVPLYFEAQARLYRNRWYWADKEVATATRTWRLAYQPLTRKYRMSLGGLQQTYDSLNSAVLTMQRASQWKIAEASEFDQDSAHYVEFSYKLDTTLLPRPMQIGIEGQPDWNMNINKSLRFE
jgi:hypothetical protein